MADNINVSPSTTGTPVAVATESCTVNSVAGVQVQDIKLGYGPHGTFTQVDTGAGLPVAVQGTVAVSLASAPLPTGAAADGTDGSGITPPTAGVGIRGWLSGIYQKLSATLAVSIASLPLPSGASTAAKQPALGTAGSASTDVITVQGITSGTAQPVSGTFFQATQPVSAASLPLPSGAATSAKQPALGTAGTASTDVLSVQGVVGMTPFTNVPNPGTSCVSGVTASDITDTTSTALLAAPGASLRNYITHLIVSNNGATGTRVDILDGTTVIYSGFAIASGGGFSIPFPTPLRQPTQNAVINVKCATAGAALRASACGFIAA